MSLTLSKSIADSFEKLKGILPDNKRTPVVKKLGKELVTGMVQKLNEPLLSDSTPNERLVLIEGLGRALETAQVPLPSFVSRKELELFVKKYGVLKSFSYMANKSETSISKGVPVPLDGALKRWEVACVKAPSFSDNIEDDFI